MSGPRDTVDFAQGPRTEAEKLHLQAHQLTDESLESTRRMFRMLEESKDAGIKTLVALDEQGEQLDRVEEGMDRINADMRQTERALTGMEQCCGMCSCPCSKKSEFKENEKTWRSSQDGRVISGQPSRVVDQRNGGVPMTGGGGGQFITRITNDAREEEMEDNMQGVSSMLGNLKNMAIDMGQEIGSQNVQLERINVKAESNKSRIQAANERAQKLLK